MSSVEERLAKVERELELLRTQQKRLPIAEIDRRFKDDPILAEIFRLAQEDSSEDLSTSTE